MFAGLIKALTEGGGLIRFLTVLVILAIFVILGVIVVSMGPPRPSGFSRLSAISSIVVLVVATIATVATVTVVTATATATSATTVVGRRCQPNLLQVFVEHDAHCAVCSGGRDFADDVMRGRFVPEFVESVLRSNVAGLFCVDVASSDPP
jgi:hypothetical protein